MAARKRGVALVRWLATRPVRTCKSTWECCLCDRLICWNDRYRDGGWGKRAHVGCVEVATKGKANAT